MTRILTFGVLAALAALAQPAAARQWTDSTGHYKIDAELLGFSDALAVLKKDNQQLVVIPLEKLSAQDRAYVQSKEAAEAVHAAADKQQVWTMRNGLKVVGKVVDYGRKDITIQRRRGKVYVNDQLLDNLPPIAQRMAPKVIAHFEKTPLETNKDVEKWILTLKGEPRTYHLEGVVLELENGDEHNVPFFFFSDEDLKVLQPGWVRWSAAEKQQAQHEQESLMLQAQAQAYQQDRRFQQQATVMQLELQAYDAGLFDLWEVSLFPGQGVTGAPKMVVVPARNSRAATIEAMQRNPGYVAGAAAKVGR
jgi:hypothetical protein